MRHESWYRAAAACVMVVTMAVALFHRVKAARSREVISHKEEGYLFATILRLMGLGLWMAIVGYLIAPDYVAWAKLPLTSGWRWAGVALGCAIPALMYWTLANLGGNLTDTVVTRRAATLVTRGPYAFVRHPFYVTVALLLVSLTLIAANGLIAIFGIGVLAMLAVRTRKEEAMLVTRFGDQYLEYAKRTPRFVPQPFR